MDLQMNCWITYASLSGWIATVAAGYRIMAHVLHYLFLFTRDEFIWAALSCGVYIENQMFLTDLDELMSHGAAWDFSI